MNSLTVKKKYASISASAVLLGLAILTKGPAALLVFILTIIVYFIYNKFRFSVSLKPMITGLLILLITGGSWFIVQIALGHHDTVVQFIEYQARLFATRDSGHGGFLFYHFVVLMFGVFPASAWALPAILRPGKYRRLMSENQKQFFNWNLILFWVVLVLFTIVRTKIIHYSSLCYLPLTFIAAMYLHKTIEMGTNFNILSRISLIIIASVIALGLICLQLFMAFKNDILNSGFIHDSFVLGNLQADVHWSGFEFVPGLFLLAGVIFSIVNKMSALLKTVIILCCSLAFTWVSMILIVPKAEEYSQNAAIEFYKSLQNKNVYLTTLDFKSYAHLFYSQKQPGSQDIGRGDEWLLTGNIDKPAYFVCKISSCDEIASKYPQLHKLYEKNGFVFLERKPMETK